MPITYYHKLEKQPVWILIDVLNLPFILDENEGFKIPAYAPFINETGRINSRSIDTFYFRKNGLQSNIFEIGDEVEFRRNVWIRDLI